jgi:hypothetical protein
MDDFVEFLNAGGLVDATFLWAGRTKRSFCQTAAIYSPIRVENFSAEVAHDFCIHFLSWLHELVRNFIGLDQASPEGHEHFAHGGLARGNSAGKTDLQQTGLGGRLFTTETQRNSEKKIVLCVSVYA